MGDWQSLVGLIRRVHTGSLLPNWLTLPTTWSSCGLTVCGTRWQSQPSANLVFYRGVIKFLKTFFVVYQINTGFQLIKIHDFSQQILNLHYCFLLFFFLVFYVLARSSQNHQILPIKPAVILLIKDSFNSSSNFQTLSYF